VQLQRIARVIEQCAFEAISFARQYAGATAVTFNLEHLGRLLVDFDGSAANAQ
jgi:hypothetical protein